LRAQHDVTIAIENVPTDDKSAWEEALGKSAEEIIDILKEINSRNIGVTFDVGHANTISDPDGFVVKLAPCVMSLCNHHFLRAKQYLSYNLNYTCFTKNK